ncbi:MAG: hypothetical protein II186_07020, partial [Erysipelotrichales bacterium]|nr:hypothetical protein [Erysipelotrichales bacterium]
TKWPSYDPKYLVTDTVKLATNVNGKNRGVAEVAKGATEEEALEAAKKIPTVWAQMEGKTIVKIIYVPGKIINIVVR